MNEGSRHSKKTTRRRLSGHRIENAPLIEYQMFQSEMVNTVYIVILHDQNQLGDNLFGKVKLKVEPLPTLLSTQILPPCSSTNFLANVNPSPVPSVLCA
jgi:hypothetical protein